MIMRIPIRFDYPVQINYHDGSVETSSVFPAGRGLISCTFCKINGYDANNNRVTNLVGYDGIELMKRCPHCNYDKHVTDFGYSGRTTNRKREQSQCTDCRGRY
ncbi:MAG: hypothetical protein LKF87_08115 [Clostridium tyrobutyricum]|jgi:hypothetical protein|uniref:hypothetical protein n=1 Tax=Clostridium tyrobutyricum TaxID=1519 RepID=UPI001C3855EC|nr:hypothetical protein [Clostridium tyrobutyricum]MBV4420349.1 hypothetical protein [Clostridium tyrobutyricum]MCH4198547.1 hypothetical protein [Clostridium tyrobutyricum]MCH4237741.1 hypothetical protein [Clostridium tyrobutyricum]MCH4258917.1 hypothetical protein [Clostridium tyrobutyricum]MCI1239734.1 hypothetical protein [Clostridium tyrobutyricum]